MSAPVLADYNRAVGFLPWQAHSLVSGGEVNPGWIDDHRFWYRDQTAAGDRYQLVDAAAGTQEPLFDLQHLTAALNQALGEAIDPHQLQPKNIQVSADLQWVTFEYGHCRWELDRATSECSKLTGQLLKQPSNSSPSGRYQVLVRDHNLFLYDNQQDREQQLTSDGEAHWGYDRTDAFGTALRPAVSWSPDSERLATFKQDTRRVRHYHLLESVMEERQEQHLHEYPYVLPGDEELPEATLVILDGSGQRVEPDLPALQGVMPPQLIWSNDGKTLYVIHQQRGLHTAILYRVDAHTGRCEELLREEAGQQRVELHAYQGRSRFVDDQDGRRTEWYQPLNVTFLPGQDAFTWYSERDGWGHLYLYRLSDGQLLGRITSGAWMVHDLLRVTGDWVYFTAAGREGERDPYYSHLYRCHLDGSGLELLTPEDAHHELVVSPGGDYFVDTYSRVDLPPRTVIRDADGTATMTLQVADIAALEASGWSYPERFEVQARDGKTSIYGIIIRPSNFDPDRSYPVLDGIYPGPHNIHVPKRFPLPAADGLGGNPDFWRAQALAELGFVVVMIDGLGTALRGRAFQNHSYRNLANAGGLADHITGIKQLARSRPYMDLERVGIYGISAGGYATMRAMVDYPDFYKVAVSCSGNYDPRFDKAGWVERYQGLLTEETAANYRRQPVMTRIERLSGKLMLAHGALDDNVHPTLTTQLIAALIKANKDFELLILPGMRHGILNHPYFIRKQWGFFVKHFLGGEVPTDFAVPPAS